MTVKGAFGVELSGPYEARAALLEAFAKASIAAQYIPPTVAGLDEEAKGWVRAEFHEGTDSPSLEFQQECLARVTAAAEQFGYEFRASSVVVGAAAQLVHVVDTRTGAVIMKSFGEPAPEELVALAHHSGIPFEAIAVREPDGLWDVPEK
ncbi:hypothetical protein ACIQ9J_25955 [Streptomyces sp. NPDC094153]|uniref:hypothetical protein n=1 Tax=Streptomyces sp. NPDC094153 TaxID=3366058 RepID=UPI0038130CE1